MNKQSQPIYKNPDSSPRERAKDIISQMTLEEKISQMVHSALAVNRLDVPEYNWWNECLHGVARAGVATVFPQAIGLAATWNEHLMHEVAVCISDEARAKYHEAVRNGVRDIYTGLTFWSPNINIFRDPRWGRGQETYGEDPYLTARMGVAFVKGLQGDDPQYLKLVATPKHFAVHSGPESLRHRFDAKASPRDMRETYLPAFEACVKEGGAVSIMGAYNRTNGEPCCASKTLLQDILRDEWGFEGYVVSDCGAIKDIHEHHQVVDTPEEAAAMAVNNGCDLNCGGVYLSLIDAVRQGLIAEETIDESLQRLYEARFRLGMFDPPERVPYAQIPFEVNDCEKHRCKALQAARESIVLLKNQGQILPLDKTRLKRIAVIGPNADEKGVLLGNYHGIPSSSVTPLEGIVAATEGRCEVLHAQGCPLSAIDRSGFAEAIACAQEADVAILVLGLSNSLEGEEGEVANSDGGGDKSTLDLPGVQEELLKEVFATKTPVVLVLMTGSPVSVNWARDYVPGILVSWYPGEEGGTALTDVLFGEYNPSGRLPVTFYKSVEQLPPFTDYSMQGRTYRFMEVEPLFRFGFGLSYTEFRYDNLRMETNSETGDIDVQVDVENIGERDGEEVVQLYISHLEAPVPVPIRHLEGFRKISLLAGEKKTVTLTVHTKAFRVYDDAGDSFLEPGKFILSIGGRQPSGNVEEDSGFVISEETTIE